MSTCRLDSAPTVKRFIDPTFLTDEIKDPSIIKTPDGFYHIYASVGNSVTQKWRVGHFVSTDPHGPWTELPHVVFDGVWGRELCAPAVTYCKERTTDPYVMYIQTSCFTENGFIVKATSSDGSHFFGTMDPEITSDHLSGSRLPVKGVYDAGITDLQLKGTHYECLLVSGYRAIGCGDLYASVRAANKHEGPWPKAHLLMAQEDLPFHNKPSYKHFEWGLEGAKIIALAEDLFLLIGVCFKPLPPEHAGTRQRVFFSVGRSLDGKFYPWSLPLEGNAGIFEGEHGHPDTFIEGNTCWIYYQHRYGENKPWYLRIAHFDLSALQTEAYNVLQDHRLSLDHAQDVPELHTVHL